MPADKTELADLRREIDAIDDALHDLLMRRVTLTGRVAASKPQGGVPLRPAREAEILRRLVGRHSGRFPKAVVARIWREIVSANTALQAPFAIAVLAGRAEGEALVEVARSHFGALTPMQCLATASSVLRAVGDGSASAGLLPLPKVEEAEPWWRLLAGSAKADGGEHPRIVARLPFAPGTPPAQEGLAVSLAPNQPTGRDRSYLVIELAGEVSRSTLKARLAAAGLAALELQAADGQLLVEVEGFVAPDSDALAAVAGTPGIAHALCIGSYAVPFTAAELAQ